MCVHNRALLRRRQGQEERRGRRIRRHQGRGQEAQAGAEGGEVVFVREKEHTNDTLDAVVSQLRVFQTTATSVLFCEALVGTLVVVVVGHVCNPLWKSIDNLSVLCHGPLACG